MSDITNPNPISPPLPPPPPPPPPPPDSTPPLSASSDWQPDSGRAARYGQTSPGQWSPPREPAAFPQPTASPGWPDDSGAVPRYGQPDVQPRYGQGSASPSWAEDSAVVLRYGQPAPGPRYDQGSPSSGGGRPGGDTGPGQTRHGPADRAEGYGPAGLAPGHGEAGSASGHGQTGSAAGYGQAAPTPGYGNTAPASGYGRPGQAAVLPAGAAFDPDYRSQPNPQAGSARPAGPTLLRSLFDLSFTTFLTRRTAPVIYVIGLVAIGLGAIITVFTGLTGALAALGDSDTLGLGVALLFGTLITVPIVAGFLVILLRQGVEGAVALVIVAENTGRTAEAVAQQADSGTHDNG